jgi:hypothetical protein
MTMTWCRRASAVVAWCSASRRRSAARAWIRAMRPAVRAHRFEPRRPLRRSGLTWRAARRCTARSRACAAARLRGAGTRATSAPSGAATTSRSRTPASTPTTGCARSAQAWAGRADARPASIVKEQYQRRPSQLTVAARIRAAPAPIRLSSAVVGSCVLTRPMRGSTTCMRSSTRIAPVVNRHDTRPRCRDLNRGKPVFGPRRFPDLPCDHCFRPRASASSPEL